MAGDLIAAGGAIISPLLGIQGIIIDLLVAILFIAIGYFVALLLGYIVKKVLVKAGLDSWMKKAKLDDSIGHVHLSSVAAIITKWYVFILFLIPASEAIRSVQLGELLFRLAVWLPNLIVAVIIILFILIVADYVGDRIKKAKMKGIKLLADTTEVVMVIFGALIAAKQIGINVEIAENILLIVVASITLAFALALGIGFGFGFREEAKEIIKSIKKKI